MSENPLVVSARSLSLLVLAVVLVGVTVGGNHSNRVQLLGEAQTLGSMQWVVNRAPQSAPERTDDCVAELADIQKNEHLEGLSPLDFAFSQDQRVDAFAGYYLRQQNNSVRPIRVVESEYAINGATSAAWISTLFDRGKGLIIPFARNNRLQEDQCVGTNKTGANRVCIESTKVIYEQIPADSTNATNSWSAKLDSPELGDNGSVEFVCEGHADGMKIVVYRYVMLHSFNSGFYMTVSKLDDNHSYLSPLFSLTDQSIGSRLAQLARSYGIDGTPTGDANLAKTVAKVYRSLYEKQLSFGLSSGDVDVSSESAVWVLTVAALLLLITLRNRLILLVNSTDEGHGTPWLMLDGREGLERAVANGWLASLLIGPWMLAQVLINNTTDGIAAQSAGQFSATASFLTMTIVLVVLGWVSITTWLLSCRLRRNRLAATRQLSSKI